MENVYVQCTCTIGKTSTQGKRQWSFIMTQKQKPQSLSHTKHNEKKQNSFKEKLDLVADQPICIFTIKLLSCTQLRLRKLEHGLANKVKWSNESISTREPTTFLYNFQQITMTNVISWSIYRCGTLGDGHYEISQIECTSISCKHCFPPSSYEIIRICVTVRQ